jgi:hypothetical protein
MNEPSFHHFASQMFVLEIAHADAVRRVEGANKFLTTVIGDLLPKNLIIEGSSETYHYLHHGELKTVATMLLCCSDDSGWALWVKTPGGDVPLIDAPCLAVMHHAGTVARLNSGLVPLFSKIKAALSLRSSAGDELPLPWQIVLLPQEDG